MHRLGQPSGVLFDMICRIPALGSGELCSFSKVCLHAYRDLLERNGSSSGKPPRIQRQMSHQEDSKQDTLCALVAEAGVRRHEKIPLSSPIQSRSFEQLLKPKSGQFPKLLSDKSSSGGEARKERP